MQDSWPAKRQRCSVLPRFIRFPEWLDSMQRDIRVVQEAGIYAQRVRSAGDTGDNVVWQASTRE